METVKKLLGLFVVICASIWITGMVYEHVQRDIRVEIRSEKAMEIKAKAIALSATMQALGYNKETADKVAAQKTLALELNH